MDTKQKMNQKYELRLKFLKKNGRSMEKEDKQRAD